MADVALAVKATQATPLDYSVPGGQEIILKSVRSAFNGAAAAGSYVPTVVLKDTYGNEVGSYVLGQTLAVGVSADISWFPGVKAAAAAAGGSGIQFATSPQSGTWLDITTTATDAAGNGATIEDDGGGGWTFLTKNGGNFGPGFYFSTAAGAADGLGLIEAVETSVNGNFTCVDGEATSTGTGSPTGVIGAATVHNGNLGTGVVAQAVTNGTGAATGVSATAQKSGGGTGTVKALQAFVPSAAAGDFVIYCQSNVGGGGSTVPIFEVRADGTIHGLTGGSIHFDL